MAVQDNGIWASGDGGLTWPPPKCWSRGPQHRHAKARPVAGRQRGHRDCVWSLHKSSGWRVSQTYGAAFSGMHQWPDPPGHVVGHPTSIFKSFHDQGVDDTSGEFLKGFAATDDLGSSWTQYAVVRQTSGTFRSSARLVLRSGRNVPVQYQAIRTGFDTTQNFEIVHLVRMTMSPPSTMASVYFPAMNGFGGIGISPPDWDWHHVFGVDPKDSQHLIAPDVINGKIMESHDGGDNWSEIPGLTSLVTDAGRFRSGAGASPFNVGIFPAFQFDVGHFPFASHVSFSGDDPNSVAIGTATERPLCLQGQGRYLDQGTEFGARYGHHLRRLDVPDGCLCLDPGPWPLEADRQSGRYERTPALRHPILPH